MSKKIKVEIKDIVLSLLQINAGEGLTSNKEIHRYVNDVLAQMNQNSFRNSAINGAISSLVTQKDIVCEKGAYRLASGNERKSGCQKPKSSKPKKMIGMFNSGTKDFTVLVGKDKVKKIKLTNQNQIKQLGHNCLVELKSHKGETSLTKILAHSLKGNEHLISMYEEGIYVGFTPGAEKEALKISRVITDEDLAYRKNLRHLPFVTIDGETSKDFDDAVYAEPYVVDGEVKGKKLFVAIADVANYVMPNSEIDKCAKMLGNSTYFPNAVNPMLPEVLSNDICSLVPHEDRLVMVIEMIIDNNGDKVKSKIYRAVINSAQRLTYTIVQGILDDGFDCLIDPTGYLESLKNLFDIYQLRKSQKIERGALSIESDEQAFKLSPNGDVISYYAKERTDANKLIEEMMILANISAGEALAPYIGIYRVHDQPARAQVKGFFEYLDSIEFSYDFDVNILENDEIDIDPKVIADILNDAVGHSLESEISKRAAQMQTKAKYQVDNTGHYGLVLDTYSHSTSPIRRYPDLVLHRLLIAFLKLGGPGGYAYQREEIKRICNGTDDVYIGINKTEVASAKAERSATYRSKLAVYKLQVNQIFSVSNLDISPVGLFIDLDGGEVTGFLNSEKLAALGYCYCEDTNSYIGQAKKLMPITAETKIDVKISHVDVFTKRMSFSFVGFTQEEIEDDVIAA